MRRSPPQRPVGARVERDRPEIPLNRDAPFLESISECRASYLLRSRPEAREMTLVWRSKEFRQSSVSVLALKVRVDVPDVLTDDRAELIGRARSYVGKIPGAVSGRGGHDATHR